MFALSIPFVALAVGLLVAAILRPTGSQVPSRSISAGLSRAVRLAVVASFAAPLALSLALPSSRIGLALPAPLDRFLALEVDPTRALLAMGIAVLALASPTVDRERRRSMLASRLLVAAAGLIVFLAAEPALMGIGVALGAAAIAFGRGSGALGRDAWSKGALILAPGLVLIGVTARGIAPTSPLTLPSTPLPTPTEGDSATAAGILAIVLATIAIVESTRPIAARRGRARSRARRRGPRPLSGAYLAAALLGVLPVAILVHGTPPIERTAIALLGAGLVLTGALAALSLATEERSGDASPAIAAGFSLLASATGIGPLAVAPIIVTALAAEIECARRATGPGIRHRSGAEEEVVPRGDTPLGMDTVDTASRRAAISEYHPVARIFGLVARHGGIALAVANTRVATLSRLFDTASSAFGLGFRMAALAALGAILFEARAAARESRRILRPRAPASGSSPETDIDEPSVSIAPAESPKESGIAPNPSSSASARAPASRALLAPYETAIIGVSFIAASVLLRPDPTDSTTSIATIALFIAWIAGWTHLLFRRSVGSGRRWRISLLASRAIIAISRGARNVLASISHGGRGTLRVASDVARHIVDELILGDLVEAILRGSLAFASRALRSLGARVRHAGDAWLWILAMLLLLAGALRAWSAT
jgi:hypothetical protein